MKVRELIERIPELRGETVQLAPLRGGVSNRCFLLSGDFGRWVLRLNADVPGVDRARERRVLAALGSESWAPVVIRNAIDDGYLLYEYLDAPIWTKEHARSEEGQQEIGCWLRRLHARPAPAIPENDPVSALDDYIVKLSPGKRSRLAADAERVAQDWSADGHRWSRALCHLDLISTNLLGAGRLDAVIDWEFAGRAEPALDLALYLHYHDLDLESGEPLMTGYGAEPALVDRVGVGLRLAQLLDEAWRGLMAEQSGQRA